MSRGRSGIRSLYRSISARARSSGWRPSTAAIYSSKSASGRSPAYWRDAAVSDPGLSFAAVVQRASRHTDVFGGAAGRLLAVGDASAGRDLDPWDEAHRVAREAQYSIYVEPDLLQEALAPQK